jgi:hypothetical protein
VYKLNQAVCEATQDWSLKDSIGDIAVHDAYTIDALIDFYVKDDEELMKLTDKELVNLIN